MAYIKEVLAREAYYLDGAATDDGWMVRVVVVEKKSKGSAGGKAWHALYEVCLDEHCEPQYHVRRGFWDRGIPTGPGDTEAPEPAPVTLSPEPESNLESEAERGGDVMPSVDEPVDVEDGFDPEQGLTEDEGGAVEDPSEEEPPEADLETEVAIEVDEEPLVEEVSSDEDSLPAEPNAGDLEETAPTETVVKPYVASGPERPARHEVQGPPQVSFRYVYHEAVSDQLEEETGEDSEPVEE